MDAEELLRKYATGERDFAGVDLSGIVLTKYYDDELIGRYQIREDSWPDGAILRGINLSGANLEGANLQKVDLMGANLSGANLAGANLHGARLNEALLSGANLREAVLCWARLRETNLSKAVLEWANLGGAYLNGAVLQRAKLRGAHLSTDECIDVDFSGADMREASCSFCSPRERCNFSKVNWNRAQMQQCMFVDCDFTKVSFRKARILEVTFLRCNLTGVNRMGILAPECYMKDSIHPNGKWVSYCSL